MDFEKWIYLRNSRKEIRIKKFEEKNSGNSNKEIRRKKSNGKFRKKKSKRKLEERNW